MQSPRISTPTRRLRSGILCLAILVHFAGCTLCSAPYDYDYGGFVTKTPRNDMKHGRVGSIFSDPSLSETVVAKSIEPQDAHVDGIEIDDPAPLDD